MKNPFRKSPLTEDTLRHIRSHGRDPYTRVLISFRWFSIVLLGADKRPTWTDSEGNEWPLAKIEAMPKPGYEHGFGYGRRDLPPERTILKPWDEPLSDGESVAAVTVVSSEAYEGPSVACMRPVLSPSERGLVAQDDGTIEYHQEYDERDLDRAEDEGMVAYNRCPATTVTDYRVGRLVMTYRCDLEVGHDGDHHIGFPVNAYFTGNACADLPDPGLVERPAGMTHDGLDRRYTCSNCDRPRVEHIEGKRVSPEDDSRTYGVWCGRGLDTRWKAKPR